MASIGRSWKVGAVCVALAASGVVAVPAAIGAGPSTQPLGCDVPGISTSIAPWSTTWSTTLNGGTGPATVTPGSTVTVGLTYASGIVNGGPTSYFRTRIVAEVSPGGQTATGGWSAATLVPNGVQAPGASLTATLPTLSPGGYAVGIKYVQGEIYSGGPPGVGLLAATINCNGRTSTDGNPYATSNPTTAPIRFGDTSLTVQPSQTLAIASVAGQVPGVAAVRAVPSGSTSAITVTGSGWSPNLTTGQLTADVCSLGGGDCSPVGAFATDLSTDAFGSLAGTLSIPAAETSTTGNRFLTVYEPGGSTSVPLLVLGTPFISVSPTSALVGDTVSVFGNNFDPQRTVAVFTCTAYPGPCGLKGPDSTTTALVGGQFSISGIDVGGSQTRAIGAQQDNGGPPGGWPRATTPLAVLDPSTTTTVSAPADVSWPAGDVSAQATVTGLADEATGDVTVSVFAGTACTGTPVFVVSAAIDPPVAGSATVAVDLPLGGPGTYSWVANYIGSAPASASACGAPGSTTVVAPASGQLDITVDGTEIELGTQSVPMATLSGVETSATGTLAFELFAGTACTGSPVASTSVAVTGPDVYSPTGTAPASTGPFIWRVSYSGDANHAPLSACDALNARVDVVSLPGPATDVVVGPVTEAGDVVNDQLRVTWSEAAAGGGMPVSGALVQIYAAGSSTPLFSESLAGGLGTYTAIGFDPMQPVDVTVTLQNSLGDSPESARQTITPNRTPLAPTITGFAPAGSGALTVRWVAGATAFPSQGYRLDLEPGGVVVDVAGGPGERQYTFTGLSNGTAYSVAVRAVPPTTGVIGLGLSAPGQAGPVTAVGAPGVPTVTEVTPRVNAIRIAWSPPADTGGLAITGYQLTNVTTGVPRNLGATVQLVTLGQLSPSIAYTFELRAVNSAGASAAVVIGPVSPASGPPGAPTGVQGVQVPGATPTVRVTWERPPTNGGQLVQYQAQAVNTATGAVAKRLLTPVTVPPDEPTRSLDLDGLVLGRTYTFQVRALTSASGTWGPWSDPSASVTLPTVPGSPTGLAKLEYRGAVGVTWGPPTSDGGSPITQYRVALRNSANTVDVCVVTVPAAAPRSFIFRNDAPVAGCPAIWPAPGLTPSTSYRINVKAMNAIGLSTNTNVISVRPLGSSGPLPPPLP